MKMSEIIDKVSGLYRETRTKLEEANKEWNQIKRKIAEAVYVNGENITLAEYNRLKEQEINLKREAATLVDYLEGICAARELLMDLGFDTEVE